MGNKIQLKLNSSTGVTRGLLRFASDKHGKHIGVIKPNDGSFHPELAVKGREINVK